MRTILRIHLIKAAQIFSENRFFRSGSSKRLLSSNEIQFTSKFFQCVCQILYVGNLVKPTYHIQTFGKEERWRRTLTNMLRCNVNDRQQNWYAYVSTLIYSSNNEIRRSTRNCLFDPMLNLRIPYFALNSTGSSRKMLTAAE